MSESSKGAAYAALGLVLATAAGALWLAPLVLIGIVVAVYGTVKMGVSLIFESIT